MYYKFIFIPWGIEEMPILLAVILGQGFILFKGRYLLDMVNFYSLAVTILHCLFITTKYILLNGKDRTRVRSFFLNYKMNLK